MRAGAMVVWALAAGAAADTACFPRAGCVECGGACGLAKAYARAGGDLPPRRESEPAAGGSDPEIGHMPGYFLRNMTPGKSLDLTLPYAPAWLEGHKVYRVLPFLFPAGMKYHYDGYAHPVKFAFGADKALSFRGQPYHSDTLDNRSTCVLFESGTGPWFGKDMPIMHPKLCMKNPAVLAFPINGQLWLTIDTPQWGRVDPDTLDTLPVGSPTGFDGGAPPISLNAHPACDHATGDKDCFVCHPCADGGRSWEGGTVTDTICISRVRTHGDAVNGGAIDLEEVSRAAIPGNETLMVQHNHEPCMSRNFIVVHLDSFRPKAPAPENGGLLFMLNQKMDNKWMVMDRRTNVSRILSSGQFNLISNHIGNCVEDGDDIIADLAPGTDVYLDNYFEHNLVKRDRRWTKIMQQPTRCRIPQAGDLPIRCEKMLQPASPADWDFFFDFQTFSPLWKGDPASRWVYGLAPADEAALWLNMFVKVDAKARRVVATWARPGVYVTEANFIPRPGGADEDDGVLFSVLYNQTSDESSVVLFDARSLQLLGQTPMGFVVPFHSHGTVCTPQRCFSNP